jgi:hypothetical protein
MGRAGRVWLMEVMGVGAVWLLPPSSGFYGWGGWSELLVWDRDFVTGYICRCLYSMV